MDQNQEQIAQLVAKLEVLLKKQQNFNIEVNEIRRDIQILKNTQKGALPEAPKKVIETPISEEIKVVVEVKKPAIEETKVETIEPRITPEAPKQPVTNISKPKKGKSNIEKFIGENLINKIGILITIIGVVIGAKYSIENNLISPLTRIILGYVIGLGLVGFGIKLKAKYLSYSAVLVSGALAIMYFITFAAYSFYGLFPQTMAFGIMLLFTVFGVVASLNYDKKIIAHIGLVGAYAVPFLLSNNSGNVTVLFGYVALINIGILIISFRKYWKSLFYSAFIFTWLIYFVWLAFSYNYDEHFKLALIVLFLFFVLFYITSLAYKFIKLEKFRASDVILILLNSFIFYGLGLGLLSDDPVGKELAGVFTLGNGVIHFITSVIIYKKKLADRNLFYLITGLVLTFITITVPIQLDGNWVTLIWALEAALLFWIGRTKNVKFYETLSYILILLTTISLTQDWGDTYDSYFINTDNLSICPFLNSTLLTGILCVLSFGFIHWIQTKHRLTTRTSLSKIMFFIVPILIIIMLFCSFYLEVEYFWEVMYKKSKIDIANLGGSNYPKFNYDLRGFGTVWLFIYTMVFISVLAFVNTLKIKNRVLGIATLILSILCGFLFLSGGLYTLSELRESYIDQALAEYYTIGFSNVWMRYVAIAFFAILLFSIYKLIRQPFLKINFKIPFELLIHIAILWVTSSELLNWMDLSGSTQSYKLGLSILWGVYALVLIALGIWKNKKYLRIAAIVLFGVTLIKLFFYDIASLNTISKTIVFVSLGVLLLIISFLYNKYKHIIADENEK